MLVGQIMSYAVNCNTCGKPFKKKSYLSQERYCGVIGCGDKKLELHYEKLEHESELAYLICFEEQVEPIWLPKRFCQVEIEDSIIHLPAWLAFKNEIRKYEK